jgi:hypothetical protein
MKKSGRGEVIASDGAVGGTGEAKETGHGLVLLLVRSRTIERQMPKLRLRAAAIVDAYAMVGLH